MILSLKDEADDRCTSCSRDEEDAVDEHMQPRRRSQHHATDSRIQAGIMAFRERSARKCVQYGAMAVEPESFSCISGH